MQLSLGGRQCLEAYDPGDMNHATLKEVQELMKGDGSGRVQR